MRHVPTSPQECSRVIHSKEATHSRDILSRAAILSSNPTLPSSRMLPNSHTGHSLRLPSQQPPSAATHSPLLPHRQAASTAPTPPTTSPSDKNYIQDMTLHPCYIWGFLYKKGEKIGFFAFFL